MINSLPKLSDSGTSRKGDINGDEPISSTGTRSSKISVRCSSRRASQTSNSLRLSTGFGANASTPKTPRLPLQDFIVYFHYSDDSAKQRELYLRLIKSLGGSVQNFFDSSVTHLITSRKAFKQDYESVREIYIPDNNAQQGSSSKTTKTPVLNSTSSIPLTPGLSKNDSNLKLSSYSRKERTPLMAVNTPKFQRSNLENAATASAGHSIRKYLNNDLAKKCVEFDCQVWLLSDWKEFVYPLVHDRSEYRSLFEEPNLQLSQFLNADAPGFRALGSIRDHLGGIKVKTLASSSTTATMADRIPPDYSLFKYPIAMVLDSQRRFRPQIKQYTGYLKGLYPKIVFENPNPVGPFIKPKSNSAGHSTSVNKSTASKDKQESALRLKYPKVFAERDLLKRLSYCSNHYCKEGFCEICMHVKDPFHKERVAATNYCEIDELLSSFKSRCIRSPVSAESDLKRAGASDNPQSEGGGGKMQCSSPCNRYLNRKSIAATPIPDEETATHREDEFRPALREYILKEIEKKKMEQLRRAEELEAKECVDAIVEKSKDEEEVEKEGDVDADVGVDDASVVLNEAAVDADVKIVNYVDVKDDDDDDDDDDDGDRLSDKENNQAIVVESNTSEVKVCISPPSAFRHSRAKGLLNKRKSKLTSNRMKKQARYSTPDLPEAPSGSDEINACVQSIIIQYANDEKGLLGVGRQQQQGLAEGEVDGCQDDATNQSIPMNIPIQPSSDLDRGLEDIICSLRKSNTMDLVDTDGTANGSLVISDKDCISYLTRSQAKRLESK